MFICDHVHIQQTAKTKIHYNVQTRSRLR